MDLCTGLTKSRILTQSLKLPPKKKYDPKVPNRIKQKLLLLSTYLSTNCNTWNSFYRSSSLPSKWLKIFSLNWNYKMFFILMAAFTVVKNKNYRNKRLINSPKGSRKHFPASAYRLLNSELALSDECFVCSW